ncbi:MAG: peptide/nickel transport system substrate-binding protein [Frankiaceae bacterium]|nr:peptide/nickel transport system substrate-binding protein [Frankiaceae bacterium]
MLSRRSRTAPVVLVAGIALLAGCTKVDVPSASPGATTSGDVTPTFGGTATGDTSTPTASATPAPGGVLKLVGARDVDVFDFTSGSAPTQNILRGVSRQLVSYQSGKQFTDVVGRVVADAATNVPLPFDGTSYTFTIRDGVMWNLPTPRPVTSADFARGIKRQCNPVAGGYYASYYSDTIAGLADFCTGFAKLGEKATAAQLKNYLEKHAVAGLSTPDDKTLVVKLNAPAGDFLNMMALSAASALPIESLGYLPGSDAFRKNFVSDGPYTVDSFDPGKSMKLVRNPSWTAASDPIRKAYVDEVDVTIGLNEGTAQTEIEGGTADFATDLFVPVSTLATSAGDARLQSVTDGSTQYLAFNTQSPAAGGALGKVAVRQALNIATDKAGVIQVYGGPDIAQPLNTILTPQILGYRPTDTYKTPDDAGDPATAKQMLTAAGFPNGLTVRLFYANGGKGGDIAQAIQDSWKKAGVTVQLKGMDGNVLGPLVGNPANRNGGWDIVVAPAWTPDWYGNGARTFFSPLIETGGYGNYGGYSSPAVDALIKQALAEPDGNRAADIWAQADQATMKDAPWVPLFTGKTSFFHSERLQGWSWDGLAFPDYTNVWLAQS